MLTIGVLGAGNTGRSHIRLLKEIDSYQLVGFYDGSVKTADAVSAEFDVKSFNSAEALLELCDVIDITAPTPVNFEFAQMALRKSKHVFLEKPFSNNESETKALIRLALEANSKVQIGQTERFNSAFIASRLQITDPLFIETQRHYLINTIDESCSLVMNYLIHDIDIVLSLIRGNIRSIHANGVAFINDSPDIINVRIEFDNGSAANLTVSRVALENKHTSVFFKNESYTTVDFLENSSHIVHLDKNKLSKDSHEVSNDNNAIKVLNNITLKKNIVIDSDAIKLQLQSFASAIINNTRPLVPIDDGYNAMTVANKIIEQLRLNTNFAASKTITA